jgi:hypothetical protein
VVARRVGVWGHEGGKHCGWYNGMAGHHLLCKVGSFGGRDRGNMFLSNFFHFGRMGGCSGLWGNCVWS